MYTSTSEAYTVNNVPAFLTKLWALVESPLTDELICWDESGQSFHVKDQARFAKEILPLYFKHNNIASFIRQLNMYGFRKVLNTEAANLKLDKDDMEFAHQFFVKGQEHLLDYIKRKVPSAKSGGGLGGDEAVKIEDVSSVLSQVNSVKSRQDTMTVKLESLKLENEVLWREVATLRQMHMKQQQIVNKLIQFLVSVVGNKRSSLSGGLKRKGPLMLAAATNSPSPAKIPRDESADKLYQVQSPASSPVSELDQSGPAAGASCGVAQGGGMLIDDVTDLLATAADSIPSTQQPPTSALGQADSLEPLAILDADYPASLELTDVLEDSDVVAPVAIVDMLRTTDNALSDNNATTTTAALTTTTLATTDARGPRTDLSNHIDSTYSQLTGLRELLAMSPQINIDSSMMLELFGLLDSNIPSTLCAGDEASDWNHSVDGTAAQSETNHGAIVGNELVLADDFSTSLYDPNDLESYPSMFESDLTDCLSSPVSDHPSCDILDDLYLATPKPPPSTLSVATTAAAGRAKTDNNTMEDID